MEEPDTSTPKLIEVAVSLVGPDRTRETLKCSPDDLQRYANGAKELPIEELGNLVQVIIEEQHKLLENRRKAMAKVRQQG